MLQKIEQLANRIKEAKELLEAEYDDLRLEVIVKRKRSIARMVKDLKELERKYK